MSQADVVPASVSLSSSASGTQQQQAKLVLAWEWGEGAGGELWWWWRGYNSEQTRLTIYCDPYTSRNIYWAMPHKQSLSQSQTTDVWSCSTMSKGSWYCYQMWVAGFLATPEAGHLSPQPVAPYRDPQAPTQAPTYPWSLVYLALSLLHSCPCLWPMACCPIFCLPQGGVAIFSSLSHILWWVYGYLVSDYSLPQWRLWEEREGFQSLTLSFLTRLRPWRDRVPQNELHLLKI